jgi:hypothetical protein
MKQRKLVHGFVATSAAIVLAGAGTAWAARLQEQAASAPKAVFEVASIKLDRSGGGGHHTDFSHGRLVAVNITVKTLIRRAYGLADYQILRRTFLGGFGRL